MKDSFYTNYKKRTDIRTKRWAYVLSIAWLAILCITLFSRLYWLDLLPFLEDTDNLALQLLGEFMLLRTGFFAIICDSMFITHIITCVLLLIIFRLARRARSLDAMKRNDHIAIITLNSISIIIVIVRSFLPIWEGF